jgi:hypothetical protein
VRACDENPTKGNLFVAGNHIADAHKRRRVGAIRRVLADLHGADWRRSKASMDALEKANKVLLGSQITPDEVLSSSELKPVATAAAAAAAAVGEEVGRYDGNAVWLQRYHHAVELFHFVLVEAVLCVLIYDNEFRWLLDAFWFFVIGKLVGGITGAGIFLAGTMGIGTVLLLASDHPGILNYFFYLRLCILSSLLGLSSLASFSGCIPCSLMMTISLSYGLFICSNIVLRRDRQERSYRFHLIGPALVALQLFQIIMQGRVSVWIASSLLLHIASTYVHLVIRPQFFDFDVEGYHTYIAYSLYCAGTITRLLIWILYRWILRS